MTPPDATPEVLSARLGYLLKLASQRLAAEAARALAPYEVDGRELAVLALIGAHDGLSQLEAAGRLGIDRTTMVALLDALEAKSLVTRRRSPHDRRKNAVALTPLGTERLHAAESAREEVERRFLSPVPAPDAARFLTTLRTLATAPPPPR
jgi:DNA-binding MarR family transcriptional regulator